ncbi:hydrogenase expression/formation protein [Tropicimonas sp.]|uniref:hydrogenase expression/formation protein n=1 Tax=Tropicimonas sp. TaxID=2067044 RepID=UPI003A852573
MVGNFHLPPVGFGPGSQPPDEDGTELQYMQLPQDMGCYTPHVPDVENAASLRPALTLLGQVAEAARRCGQAGIRAEFDLSRLNDANRALVAETLGQGEVSIRMKGIPAIAAQESVFAGIWVLKGAGIERVEVGPVPALALERAFHPMEPALGALAPRIAGLANAPAILTELMDKSAGFTPGRPPHVVNLTLLPHTGPDLEWLDTALGKGSVTILSRGYGNCRITATGQAQVWRVQFFNSMDTLILDTFEVTAMPEVTLAAPEDMDDSGARLGAVLEAIS